MRKLFAILLLTTLALPLHAQRFNAPSSQSAPPRPLIPSAEKAEKPKPERTGDSPSLLKRMFGARPTPTPPPTPEPEPEVKRRPKTKPKPAPDEMPTEAVAKAPKTPTVPITPATTTKPKVGKGTAKRATPAGTSVTPEDDATKFKAAKARALEDERIKDLKTKADSEVNESEAHKALVNYNRALFQKIREIDPSVSEYAGKVEQSMTRRLGAEKTN
jgi:outer membrane biosynthesis protein TonB